MIDVIVIGAGASGMFAARSLLKKGLSVLILEAAGRAGGRMATVEDERFDDAVETGAEFIHGKLPLTLKLLKKARTSKVLVEGEMLTVKNGDAVSQEEDPAWNLFLKKLGKQEEEMSIRAFLEKNFSGPRYDSLRKQVKDYAAGFDLADYNFASVLTIKKEWQHRDEAQFRPEGGYRSL